MYMIEGTKKLLDNNFKVKLKKIIKLMLIKKHYLSILFKRTNWKMNKEKFKDNLDGLNKYKSGLIFHTTLKLLSSLSEVFWENCYSSS